MAGGEQPVVEECLDLIDEHARGDVDARRPEAVGPARGVVARVCDGIDHSCDAGVDEGDRARPGAPRVIARLEGHDGGRALGGAGGELRQRVHFGVRGAGASMPSLGEHVAMSGEDDAADARVHAPGRSAGGELQRTAHGSGIRHGPLVGDHPRAVLSGSGDASAMPMTSTTQCAADTCRLPSGLSPSVPEFHRFNRSPETFRPRARGSRTVTAGSDLHRPRSTLSCRFYVNATTSDVFPGSRPAVPGVVAAVR